MFCDTKWRVISGWSPWRWQPIQVVSHGNYHWGFTHYHMVSFMIEDTLIFSHGINSIDIMRCCTPEQLQSHGNYLVLLHWLGDVVVVVSVTSTLIGPPDICLVETLLHLQPHYNLQSSTTLNQTLSNFKQYSCHIINTLKVLSTQKSCQKGNFTKA